MLSNYSLLFLLQAKIKVPEPPTCKYASEMVHFYVDNASMQVNCAFYFIYPFMIINQLFSHISRMKDGKTRENNKKENQQ